MDTKKRRRHLKTHTLTNLYSNLFLMFHFQYLRNGPVNQITSPKTSHTDESLCIRRSKSLNDFTTDRTESSALSVSQSHSDDCIIGKPINKRLHVP